MSRRSRVRIAPLTDRDRRGMFVEGVLDEVRLYGCALSEEEIRGKDQASPEGEPARTLTRLTRRG
jgi:hypothetical protein